jgi:hypothetical protein
MKLMKTHLAALMALLFAFSFSSCDKSDSRSDGSGKARMQVFLTDDPGDYDAVFVDIRDVRVNYSNDTASGWVSLGNIATGTYDLLRLVNDQDTLLADAEINSGRVQQIRLILGSNNYVMVDGTRHNLETPSAQQSGLKININQDVNEGVLYKLLLDFDVAKSIHRTGNGKYMLKPTIRAIMDAIGGSIRGQVLPANVPTAVLAIQGSDTVASTYSLNGSYWIRGLNAGAYNLHFIPTDPAYPNQVKNGIIVTANQVTLVDTVRLR